MKFARTFRKGDRVSILPDGVLGEFLRIDGFNVALIQCEDGSHRAVDVETVRHAPVVVLGKAPVTIPTHCPHGHLLDVCDAETPNSRGQLRTVRVVACGFCEYIAEVNR